MAGFLPHLRRRWYALVLLPLTLASDALSVLGAYLISYRLRALAPNTLPDLEVYFTLGAANALSLVGVAWVLGLYRPSKRQSRFDENVTVLVALGLAVALVLVGAFFIRSVSLSRLVIAYTLPLAGVFCVSGRLLLRMVDDWARSNGLGMRRVLILGAGSQACEVGERLAANPNLGFLLAGYLQAPDETPVAGLTLLGAVNDLALVLATRTVDEVWFALGELPRARLAELIAVLHGYPLVQMRLVPGVVELLTTHLVVDSLGGIPLLTLRETPLRRWSNRFLKRTLDILLALLGLVLLGPFLVVIALLVKRSSPGPIFYRQERLSRDGESFFIYKFRTMRMDAEQAGPGWTVPDDQRVTAGGRFLRQTSLDELPQLLNVLLGDMSLVGPRPERPYYVAQFQREVPKYLDRHLVKTGITGWAQIHGLRGDTSIPERIRYDLYYIENWSLLLDLRIVLVTCWQLFRGQYNAY
ncbi:undecaprenyl-phosphate glucose phosphotransferase [Anthocerotibacter panamensis]|uniref:undecaprenyl-phosphate glucose phosphotransferase n=1 Tax=Anthocerotibacter panamensis TaxID=2857077 RepID=UPI001C407082|nr:undecaprenyl-phosphate glucose phosphotransferase [Anthocerotibacter panamensis]